MAVRSGGPAPYAPPATVLGLIQSYRNRGLATPFTSDVLQRAGIADSVVPRTLQAIRLLDLVDEQGNPTPQFEGLRRAPESEFRARLNDLVRAAYADIFQFVDPAQDGLDRVRDAFRNYEPIGQLTRMVTMFVGLCAAAGIIPEENRPQGAVRQGARPAPRTRGTRRAPAPNVGTRGVASQVSHAAIPPALSGLLASLPQNGGGWSQAQRDRFVKTFEAVLDFTIPIGSGAASESDNQDE